MQGMKGMTRGEVDVDRPPGPRFRKGRRPDHARVGRAPSLPERARQAVRLAKASGPRRPRTASSARHRPQPFPPSPSGSSLGDRVPERKGERFFGGGGVGLALSRLIGARRWSHFRKDGPQLSRPSTIVENREPHGRQEIRSLLLPLGLVRRAARGHGCEPVQGLRPVHAVHQIHL